MPGTTDENAACLCKNGVPAESQIISLTYNLGGQAVALRKQVVGGSNPLYYLHSDHLGSTSLMTSSGGSVVANTTARYYPFGDWRTEPTAGVTDRGFTGHLHNNLAGNELGLVFMGARYYVPSIGRFASPDIIIPNPADPQSYNRYSYVLNSPTGLRDASGHCIFAVADTILCLAAAAKIVDYVWTAWDTGWAMHTLSDANASQGEKVVAALNIGMAVFFEVVEPDDLLPVGLPLDDVARRAFINGAEEALEAGGDAGLRAYVKDQIGDEAGDTVLNQMDELLGNCRFNSFQAGTMVMTANGSVPIEEIEPGDLVLAYNEATGEIGYYPVTDLISHIDIQVVYLTIDGETIVTTAEHPFYTSENEWIEAGELQPGDEIRAATWTTGAVEAMTIVTQPQRMYNFTVAAAHTYFVGDEQWLVHNSNGLCNIMPTGRSVTEVGRNNVQWGTGVQGANERLTWLQSASLDEAKAFLGDLTLDEAEYLRDFYRQAYDNGDGGLTALARIDLMNEVIDILSR